MANDVICINEVESLDRIVDVFIIFFFKKKIMNF